jgi:nucleoside-diphosphate-sugar epimerase
MKRTHSIVTGGAGFVGSHLCDFLIARGHQVTCLDNLLTGKKENIAPLARHSRFRFIRHDVSQPLPSLPKARFVFHLASPASPSAGSAMGYRTHSLKTIEANTTGTRRFLEYSRRSKAKFLFASTSEVYGTPLVHPQKETYWGNVNPFGPRSCYDESKRLGETLVYEYLHKFKVDARIVRIFNTYGPRLSENDGRVVSNFITQALKGKPLTIYGNGSQTRSFCYVSDLVEALWKAISTPNTKGEVFNLGNPNETTILRFAKVVMALCDKPKVKIVRKPLPQDDPIRRKPDISKAKQRLGWRPLVDIKEGLGNTIEWYRGRI